MGKGKVIIHCIYNHLHIQNPQNVPVFHSSNFARNSFSKDKMTHFKKYCKKHGCEHLKYCYIINIHKVPTSTAIFGVASNHWSIIFTRIYKYMYLSCRYCLVLDWPSLFHSPYMSVIFLNLSLTFWSDVCLFLIY